MVNTDKIKLTILLSILLLLGILFLKSCKVDPTNYSYYEDFVIREQENIEGVQYYSVTHIYTQIGMDYCTIEEINCLFETGTFNYFESCVDCYNNGVFVNFPKVNY